jgi:hypothetical protein
MSSRVSNIQGKPSLKAKLAATAISLIVAGIGCVPLYWGVLAVLEANDSLSWPQVEGKVTHSKVRATTTTTRDRSKPINQREHTSVSYSADIEYEFVVDGKTYQGTRLTVITEQFGSRDFAEATVEKYPVEARVTVSYHPDNPSQCVLEAGSWGGTGFLLALAGAFIGIPLLIAKAAWGSPDRDLTDPQWETVGLRRRFGLVFRERFIHWEPGILVHLRRDPLDWVQLLWSGLILGFIAAAVLGLPLLIWFCSRQGPVYIGKTYMNIAFLLTLPLSLVMAYVYRRHETFIDWSQQRIRVQVGWFGRDVDWSELQQVVARVPQPDKRPDTSSTGRKQYAGRVELQFAGRTHVMLATEYDRLSYQVVRDKLLNVAVDLAKQLGVPATVV